MLINGTTKTIAVLMSMVTGTGLAGAGEIVDRFDKGGWDGLNPKVPETLKLREGRLMLEDHPGREVTWSTVATKRFEGIDLRETPYLVIDLAETSRRFGVKLVGVEWGGLAKTQVLLTYRPGLKVIDIPEVTDWMPAKGDIEVRLYALGHAGRIEVRSVKLTGTLSDREKAVRERPWTSGVKPIEHAGLDALASRSGWKPVAADPGEGERTEGASLTLRWEGVEAEDLDHYNVYASTGSRVIPSNAMLVGSSPSPRFLDWGLESDTLYRYRITAVDRHGHESLPSDAVTARTADRLRVRADLNPAAWGMNAKAPAELTRSDGRLVFADRTGGEITWGSSMRQLFQGIDLGRTPYLVLDAPQVEGRLQVKLLSPVSGWEKTSVLVTERAGRHVIEVPEATGWSGTGDVRVQLYTQSDGTQIEIGLDELQIPFHFTLGNWTSECARHKTAQQPTRVVKRLVGHDHVTVGFVG